MSSVTTPSDFSKLDKWEELKRWVSTWAVDLTNQVNGNIDFTSNIKCKILDISFTAANTDTTVSHQLKKIPIGYMLIGSNVATSIYDGTVDFTNSTITLKSSAIATCKVLIF